MDTYIPLNVNRLLLAWPAFYRCQIMIPHMRTFILNQKNRLPQNKTKSKIFRNSLTHSKAYILEKRKYRIIIPTRRIGIR